MVVDSPAKVIPIVILFVAPVGPPYESLDPKP